MSGPDQPRESDWPEAFLVLVLLFAPGTLLAVLLVGLGAIPAAGEGSGHTELLLGLQSLNCLLVVAWFLARRRRPRLGSWSVWRTAGLYFLFMAVWVPFVAVAYTWLLDALGAPLEPQRQLTYFIETDFGRLAPWLSVIAVALVAPIAEEIVFRGYLYGVIKAASGAGTALLLTSVFFGLIHGVLHAVPLALLGLLFGWLRQRTGGVAAPIMAHALHNSLTLVATMLFPSIFGQVNR